MATLATDKYLRQYAEPESQLLANFPTVFQQCLVIPMYRESPAALNYFCQFIEQQQNSLLLAVINRPDSDSDIDWASYLIGTLPEVSWQSSDGLLSLHLLQNQSAVLIIDRCINGSPIDKKQGVGLARKIGGDVACQLITQGKISSPFIFNSDADARLPSDYFTAIKHASADTAALVFPYQHVSAAGGKARIATQLYELSLHYYVAGLEWSGSPYAYHTLGSIICVSAHHYAMVRGFPKRAGAEDFYLLNKLAKTGRVLSLKAPIIELICRQSDRVPFGTGPAVKRIIELGQFEQMPFYDPRIFHYLKAFNQIICVTADNGKLKEAIDTIDMAGVSLALLVECISTLKLETAIEHANKQANTPAKRLRHLQTWFDGFKTLKLLHFVRDQQHPMIPYQQWQQLIKQELYFDNLAPGMVEI